MSVRAKWLTAAATLVALGLAVLLHLAGKALGERIDRSTDPGRAAPVRTQNRLVLFTPAIVEIVFALGAGEQVVGVTRFATSPPEATRLPRVGGEVDLNYERMTRLAPNMIMTQNAGEKLQQFARSRGIPLLSLKIETTADVMSACVEIGRIVGREAQGRALAARISRDLDNVRRAVAGNDRVSCFLSVDRSPGPLKGLLSAGQDSFLNEIVDIAGGRNVFGDSPVLYPVISKETLVVRAPEVILELKPAAVGPEKTERLIGDWEALYFLHAVKNRRVHVIHHREALIPGPRIGEVARLIATTLHPGAVQFDQPEAGRHGD